MSKHPAEDALMTVTCIECGHEVTKTIKWLRSNASLKCEGEDCEAEVPIPLGKGFKPMADELKKKLKTFRDIGRDFKS